MNEETPYDRRAARRIAPLPILLTVEALLLTLAALIVVPLMPSRDGCVVPAPVVGLDTPSKMASDDPARATLGPRADERDALLRPLREATRSIAAWAGDEASRPCAARALAAWAGADALTDMRSKDARLTRGRHAAELLFAAVALDRADALTPRQAASIGRWADALARSTIDFFAHGAGPQSRVNNHRQWAALAVAAAGTLTGRPEHLAWARESADLALCAVTPKGLIPAELERGPAAWRYHRYALRPLLAMERMGAWTDAPAPCADGLDRLQDAARDPDRVARATGVPQRGPAAESAFGPMLRLPPPFAPLPIDTASSGEDVGSAASGDR